MMYDVLSGLVNVVLKYSLFISSCCSSYLGDNATLLVLACRNKYSVTKVSERTSLQIMNVKDTCTLED